MKELKLMLKGGFYALILGLVVTLTILVISEFGQISLAQTLPQPGFLAAQEEGNEYIPLTDAQPQRDITTQQFSPLGATQ